MVRFYPDLEPLMAPIDSMIPAPFNYNNGDVEEIAASVEKNGMYRPIQVWQKTDEILMGNHTWLAVKSLGAEVIPRVYCDVDEITAKRLMVADNEIARRARPDNGLLLPLLDQIKDAEGLIGTGVTEGELEVLRQLNQIPLETDEFGQWPTFSVQLPPNVLQGFRYMTREADDDRQAFELLLRLAGWSG